ncbi:hypothetical protein [Curtobacterium oceanosedimentum]|uniref:hypothetical protein n=1 Tax=Curtobacterium oceanosedimentum TaxID=465820 RepID=UPI001CE1359E|nr:hypothetical protein [Curtobacterium oceanosedimentum]MCA5923921.1 hypothetical protein [Curtobacterium oceanosedimentum]
MTWWLRVHRTLALLGLTVTLTVFSIAVGPIGMLFPSFGGGTPFAMIPVAAVVPLVISIATGASISRSPFPAPVRRTDLLELAAVLTVLALVGLIAAIGSALGVAPELSIATVRNSIAFCGLVIASRVVFGDRYQSVPGVVYLFVAALFGRGTPGNPAAWAGVVTTSTDPGSWAFALPIVLTAVIALGVQQRHGRIR